MPLSAWPARSCRTLESLVAPVLDEAMCELPSRGFLSELACENLRLSLEKRLCRSAEEAFSWFWKVFLMTPGLRTTDSGELEKIFFEQGAHAETTRFLKTFPGLERVWISQVADWQAFTADFLRHAAAFSKNRPILDFQPDLSDPHHGGRSVLRVWFAGDDAPWFYKPRSGENEKAWFELLRWLNEEGFPKTFHLLEVHPATDHSWMEAAEHRPCETVEQIAAFYFRAGALLYLYHRLGGVDLHCENLVAMGENPVIVDCEALFHESVEPENGLSRTGFLPMRTSAEQICVSALVADVFGKQTPFLFEQPVAAREFVETICAGFAEMHQFLRNRPGREAEFWEKARAMSQFCWRKIHQPTSFYAHRRRNLLTPEALRDGKPSSDKTIRDLEKGDIPVFHGPGTMDFCDWNDEKIDALLDQIRRSIRAA